MSSSQKVLIDSDILSFYIKKYPKVVCKAQKYLRQNQFFTFSIITKFEILRGIKVKSAWKQLQFFNFFCQQNEIIELNDDIINRAADIYADLYKRGQLILDC